MFDKLVATRDCSASAVGQKWRHVGQLHAESQARVSP